MSGQLRVSPVSARFAKEQREAWTARHGQVAELVHGRCQELGCGWRGPLLVRGGEVVCPRCGCVEQGQEPLL